MYSTYMLGLIYMKGTGVDIDYKKAREYLEIPGKKGDNMSNHLIGCMLYEGNGSEVDYE